MKNNISKFKYLILFIPLIFVSCTENSHIKKNEFSVYSNKWSIPILKAKLLDSLYRFSQLSEVLLRDDSAHYVLYINEFENKKVALIAITDSILFLFEQKDLNWYQTDSIIFETYAESFESTDLNGDHKKDMLIYGHPNMNGQVAPYVILCDKNDNFHIRPDIHLFNIKYDQVKKLVMSFYLGGAYGIDVKEYYQWKGDSLVLERGIENNRSNPGTENITTTFYKLDNGKRIDYKKIKDSKGIIFDTALWNYYY